MNNRKGGKEMRKGLRQRKEWSVVLILGVAVFLSLALMACQDRNNQTKKDNKVRQIKLPAKPKPVARPDLKHLIPKAPQINSSPATTAFIKKAYTYKVDASDINGDTLSYALESSPKGMTINNDSGLISWTPSAGTIGTHWVILKVSDGEFNTEQKYALKVVPSDNGIPYQCGCSITSWYPKDYGSYTSKATLEMMKKSGCQYVNILVTVYQDSLTSTVIYQRGNKTPPDDGIIKMIKHAHSLGMIVFLKVHVDVDGDYRQNIKMKNPEDWQAWFKSYETIISHYLDLAEANGVEGFVIGTELSGTEKQAKRWRAIIALARSKFSGWLTYCANHDSYANVTWWDALDFIGISAYFKLTNSYDPSVPRLVKAWQPWIRKLRVFSAKQKKDIVFMEIGYQSYDGTNTWPYHAPTKKVDLQEQADCLQAAFEALDKEPWFKGMYWWMWYWDPYQDVNGFDMYNKPAEKVMRHWCAVQ